MKQNNNIYIWCNDNPIKTIVIAALLIRIIMVVLYGHITLYPDSRGYYELAERLLRFNLTGYEGQRSPGYPIILSAVYLSYTAVVFIQLAMGILTLVYAYKTLTLCGVKEYLALISTLVIACYLPTVFFEFAILSETFTLLIITIIFYIFFGIIQKAQPSKSSYTWLAILCGYLVLIKMFYIYLACLLFVILLCRNYKSMKANFGRLTLVLLVPLFVFVGWSYVNKVNTGYFVPSTFYGYNITQNCVWFAENTTPEFQEIGDIYASYRYNNLNEKEIAMSIWEAYPELKAKTGLSFPDLSKELYDYSIATIKENPTMYLKQVFISWLDFWKTSLYYEIYNFSVPQARNIIFYICFIERIILQLIKAIFVLLIPCNIYLAVKKKKLTPSLITTLVVFAASILQALATYGTNSRFSFPFETLIVTSVILNILLYISHRKNKKATS